MAPSTQPNPSEDILEIAIELWGSNGTLREIQTPRTYAEPGDRNRGAVLYLAFSGKSGLCGDIQKEEIQPVRGYTKNKTCLRELVWASA